jgi:hypothetical protein
MLLLLSKILTFAFIASTCGIFLSEGGHPIFQSILENELKLEIGPTELWEKIPIPTYLEITFFNVTNPDAVAAGTEKPILVEMGPYVYE